MLKKKNSELNRISVDSYKSADKTPLIVILDNIRSLNNIGSVFRTSDAFLVEEILLCGISACPPNREIQKTALGATESVNWSFYKKTIDAVEKAKAEGYKIVAIEQAENSVSLEDFKISKDEKIAIILGNEVAGVSQDVMDVIDDCIEIPQYGTKHSLNISVSAGIVIWDLFVKFNNR